MTRRDEIDAEIRNQAVRLYPRCTALFELPTMVYWQIMQDMLLQYINTGVMETFDITITNNDPTASVGDQVMGYYGCMLTGEIPLSILNDDEAMLNYDFNFSYTKVNRLKAFSDPVNLGN